MSTEIRGGYEPPPQETNFEVTEASHYQELESDPALKRRTSSVLTKLKGVLDKPHPRFSDFGNVFSDILALREEAGSAAERTGAVEFLMNFVVEVRRNVASKQIPEAKQMADSAYSTWREYVELGELVNEEIYTQLFEHYARKIDEGSYGVIFKVDTEAMERDELMHNRFADAYTTGSDAAVKVLKIYEPGKVVQERDTQAKAAQAIRYFQQEYGIPDDEISHVVDPSKVYHLRLPEMPPGSGDETRAESRNNLVESLTKQRLPYHLEGTDNEPIRVVESEMFFMDFIEGEELYTIMGNYILDHVSKPPYPNHELNARLPRSNPFELEHSMLMVISNIDLDPSEELTPRMRSDLRKGIYKFLEKIKFRFHPKLLTQVRNARLAFQRSDVKHTDANERNLMIQGNPLTGEGLRSFVIDFGNEREVEILNQNMNSLVQIIENFTEKQ